MEGTAESVVVRGLVREPASGRIDHDRAGQGPLAVDQVRTLLAEGDITGDLDRGYPPGLAHVPELRADAHRHAQPIARVGGHGRRRCHRPAQEGCHEFRVPLESTGREDNTASCPHDRLDPVDQDPHSRHATVLDEEVGRAGIHDGLDAEVEQGLDDGADEGIAASAQVVVDASLHLLVRQVAGATAECGVGDLQVSAALAASDPVLPCPEGREVKQPGVEGPTTVRLPAGVLRVVVGVLGQERERGIRGVLEPLDRLAAMVDEGRGHGRVHAIEGQGREVGERLLAGVRDPGLVLVMVQGDPRHAPRDGAGAAEDVRPLVEAHIGSHLGGGQRGGEARGATAEDDDVMTQTGLHVKNLALECRPTKVLSEGASWRWRDCWSCARGTSSG